MPARPPTRPATKTQLQTGSPINDDPRVMGRMLDDLATAQQATDRTAGVVRKIATTAPLTGGGALSANLTLGIGSFGSAASGIVPASGGGTTKFLRADGTWASPAASATAMFDTTITYHFGGANFDSFNDVAFGTLGPKTLIYYDEGGASQQLNGIAGGVDGYVICLLSIDGSHTMNTANQNAGSGVANRIINRAGAGTVAMTSLGAAWFIYDGSVSRWRSLVTS